jgi:hypothetical protein
MVGSNLSRLVSSHPLLLALIIFLSIPLRNACAVEEVLVTGSPPDQMSGLDFQEYLDNQATASQLRALAQYLADAAAKASAAKLNQKMRQANVYVQEK